jgi:hypothetical protein
MLKWGTIELNYNPRLRAAAGSVYFDSISLYFVCLASIKNLFASLLLCVNNLSQRSRAAKKEGLLVHAFVRVSPACRRLARFILD